MTPVARHYITTQQCIVIPLCEQISVSGDSHDVMMMANCTAPGSNSAAGGTHDYLPPRHGIMVT